MAKYKYKYIAGNKGLCDDFVKLTIPEYNKLRAGVLLGMPISISITNRTPRIGKNVHPNSVVKFTGVSVYYMGNSNWRITNGK